MDIWSGPLPDGDALRNAALQHDRIQRSPLVRAVAIGQAVEHDSLVLELIALEVREAGAVLYWRANPVGDHVLGGPDFVVTDDTGTVYTILLPTWAVSEGMAKGNTDLVPGPPADARTMRIDVRKIGGLGISVPPGLVHDEPVEWHWTFEFRLDQP
jgi:hypothetical protein